MPHITIARARQLILDKENNINKLLNSHMEEKNYEDKEFLVDKFVLFESVPSPQEYMHKEIKVFGNI